MMMPTSMKTTLTKSQKDSAERKIEIAIDKMVDLQDMGIGCEATSRVLEMLNHLLTVIRTK